MLNLIKIMKKKITKFSALLFLISLHCCGIDSLNKLQENTNLVTEKNQKKFGIVIHGGAGTIIKENMPEELEKRYRSMLTEAVSIGYEILKDGGTSIEAVEKTIIVLENSPLFNAGKGSVFSNRKINEMDASIMDGKTLNAGAISGITNVKNPISLALVVMNKSEHVLLSNEGAENFAIQHGLEIVDRSYFHTENRYQSLIKAIKKDKFGTVGAVALDLHGNLCAGTSTGGMSNKKWGRIGDSPIIGSGTYANNRTCAISSTGWGEFFIRGVIAHDISAMMEYKNISLKEAAHEVIQKKLKSMGGTGGVIGIDKNLNTVMEFNTKGMYRASCIADSVQVKIYAKN